MLALANLLSSVYYYLGVVQSVSHLDLARQSHSNSMHTLPVLKISQLAALMLANRLLLQHSCVGCLVQLHNARCAIASEPALKVKWNVHFLQALSQPSSFFQSYLMFVAFQIQRHLHQLLTSGE